MPDRGARSPETFKILIKGILKFSSRRARYQTSPPSSSKERNTRMPAKTLSKPWILVASKDRRHKTMGIKAMSWAIRTPMASFPVSVFSSPVSSSIFMETAVELKAITKPKRTAFS